MTMRLMRASRHCKNHCADRPDLLLAGNDEGDRAVRAGLPELPDT